MAAFWLARQRRVTRVPKPCPSLDSFLATIAPVSSHLLPSPSLQQVLLRLQDELNALQLQPGGLGDDPRAPPASKGSGPRLFCGHVPKEATEDIVKAHFSRWGIVTDVYFPRHKKTLKRRPFCFVTFATRESAERALAESPLNICGIPIKNLTMVEDRDKYYKDKHEAAQAALMSALNSMGAAGALAPEQVNNVAALLAMEGVSSEAVLAMLLQGGPSSGAAPSGGVPRMALAQGMGLPQQQGGAPGYGVPAPMRFSAPAGGAQAPPPSAYFLQQAAAAQSSPPPPSLGPMRSASGPLPATPSPFGPMISREGSLSSLSSLSTDWYSTTSSGRTSLDLGSGSGGTGLFAPGAGGSGGAQQRRSSLDAAVQLRQQLMAAAAAAAAGGMPSGRAQQQMQQQQQQQQSAAAALQSAFYQPAAAPPAAAPAGAMPLPPIREGFPTSSHAWLAAAALSGAPSGHASPFFPTAALSPRSDGGGPLPLSGPSSYGGGGAVDLPFSSAGSLSAPAVIPLGLPDSSGSEQETMMLSSNTATTASSRDASSGVGDAVLQGLGQAGSGSGWPHVQEDAPAMRFSF